MIEGHSFRISYVVNSQEVQDVSVGDFTGFELTYGPATSRSFSQTMINGKSTTNSSVTFSYTLSATQSGTFTLPAMTVTVDGRKYKSGTAQVKVVKDVPASSTPSTPTHQRTQRVGEKVTDSDLFVTVTASKKNVYEQEAVLLTYKLYTLVTIESCETKLPEMDDFFSQEVRVHQQKSLSYDAHDVRIYGTLKWCH
ncbi:MAG: BatD family protein, partial [Bacteroidaceae bacterium]|nr:BatD family protein [Bacteroidaceae bacterium]